MKQPLDSEKVGQVSLRIIAVLVLLLVPLMLLAQAPQWWTVHTVTNGNPGNDYAAVNQGQVKNITIKAIAELDDELPGGAGDVLHTLKTKLSGTTANTNDYAAVNLGQLKAVAKPIFDRLLEVQYFGHPLESRTYPWLSGSANPANDYAMANIGQVKNLFSFDLTATGTNGLPDWWQQYYFGGPVPDPNAPAPSGVLVDGNPATILETYNSHLNPIDFYNGQAPILTITNGNNQTGSPGAFLSAPLVVKVTDNAGNTMSKAPVTFTVTQGGGTLQATATGTNASTLGMETNSSGYAILYFQLPNTLSTQCQITCVPATGNYTQGIVFTESSDDGSGSYSSPTLPSESQSENPVTPPVVSYPAIDVSGGAISGSIGAIALGDDNNGAFAYLDNNGGGPSTVRWVNGTVDSTFNNSTGFPKNMTYDLTGGSYTEFVQLDIYIPGCAYFVTSDGNIYGNALSYFGEGFYCNNSQIEWLYNDIYNYFGGDSSIDGLEIYGCSDKSCYGIYRKWPNGPGLRGDIEFIYYNGILSEFSADSFWITGVNNNGWALGFHDNARAIWNGQNFVFSGTNTNLNAINYQNQVIGTGNNSGFIWQSGTSVSLLSLTPADYQGQISGINPRLLSNADTNGIIHILLDATFTDPTDGSQSAKTYVLSGPYASLSSTNCTLQEVQLPDGMSTGDIRCINANGVIAGIGSMGGSTGGAAPQTMMARSMTEAAASSSPSTQAPFLAWPLEIRDVRNWSDATDDVLIEQMPRVASGTTPSDDYWKAASEKNIAWIVAHRNDGTADADNPRMPQLEFRLSGAPSTSTVKWKFKCWYDRGNDKRKARNQTEDTIIIDKTSSPIAADQPWKPEGLPQWNGDFFGGKCEVTWQVGTSPQMTARFMIGGKNPDNAKAKTFIQGRPDAGASGNLWFAYAIAKCETGEYRYNGSYYNQFRSNPSNGRLGYPAWNNDGGTTPGGYGVFQVTGNTSSNTADIPRKQIWNWQENVNGGLDLLRVKRQTAVDWMAQQRNGQNANGTALPSHTVGSVTFAEGTTHTMEDAVTMKLYNGASRAPDGFTDTGTVPGFLLDPQGAGHYCFWKNAANKWALNRYNHPNDYPTIQPFNYVSRVCSEIEP